MANQTGQRSQKRCLICVIFNRIEAPVFNPTGMSSLGAKRPVYNSHRPVQAGSDGREASEYIPTLTFLAKLKT